MSNFETWWEREGQEFLFALNTTTDDDIKLVAEVAWKNGAYCAEQAEQKPVAIGSEWKPCMKLPVVVHVREQREGESHVSTREGITPVRPDDLIMRGVAGEEYPIGRELFNKTYTFDTAAPVQQAEQEPVAWMWACAECGTEAKDGTDCRICGSCGYHKFYKAPKVATCVCAAKTQEKVKQEQVAVLDITYGREPECYATPNADDLPEGTYRLYAAPVRTKDLTDAHILVLWQETANPDAHRIERFARAVIAADREKNK